jgi:hypothetical protein
MKWLRCAPLATLAQAAGGVKKRHGNSGKTTGKSRMNPVGSGERVGLKKKCKGSCIERVVNCRIDFCFEPIVLPVLANQSDDGPEQPGIEFSVDSIVRPVDS